MWARRAEAVAEARNLAVADLVSDKFEEVLEDADTVVLCMPVGAMEGVVKKMLPFLKPKALVTDVGSVKRFVTQTLAPILGDRALFVGSHPMAGSEKAGLVHARADLFREATCIVTPEPGETPSEAVRLASEFWVSLGSRVRLLSPAAHDEVCALISHVPHLTAAALVNAVAQQLPLAFEFFGPGFRDTTRVAGGLPQMWTEILTENRTEVLKGLRALISQLELAAQALERENPVAVNQAEDCSLAPHNLSAFLSAAKHCRDNLRVG
jgi:prephenate dehydrogenase